MFRLATQEPSVTGLVRRTNLSRLTYEKMTTAKHCNLKSPPPTSCQSFWAVIGQICTAHIQKLSLPSFRSKFWQNQFSERDFLKESINWTIRRLLSVIFTVQIEYLPHFYCRCIWFTYLEYVSHTYVSHVACLSYRNDSKDSRTI